MDWRIGDIASNVKLNQDKLHFWELCHHSCVESFAQEVQSGKEDVVKTDQAIDEIEQAAKDKTDDDDVQKDEELEEPRHCDGPSREQEQQQRRQQSPQQQQDSNQQAPVLKI